MRGRKPVPTHLKIISGNPGRRPLNSAEPVPQGDLCAPPAWFNERQKEIWRTAIDAAPRGLLKNIDAPLLTKWVVAEDLHRLASEKVSELGMVVKSPGGVPMQSPFLSIMNRQAEISMRATSELGFSPTSRVRVGNSGTMSATNAFARHVGRRDRS